MRYGFWPGFARDLASISFIFRFFHRFLFSFFDNFLRNVFRNLFCRRHVSYLCQWLNIIFLFLWKLSFFSFCLFDNINNRSFLVTMCSSFNTNGERQWIIINIWTVSATAKSLTIMLLDFSCSPPRPCSPPAPHSSPGERPRPAAACETSAVSRLLQQHRYLGGALHWFQCEEVSVS